MKAGYYSPSQRGAGVTYKALGADLYAGVSGIAWFLGELASVTQADALRRTTLGAMRQARTRLERVPPGSRLGFYTGWMGVAFVAAHLGRLLAAPELTAWASQLLTQIQQLPRVACEVDLLDGRAGAIPALLVLADLLADPSLLTFARQLGDEILQRAEQGDFGWSWPSTVFAARHNLTGFSHGAAGIGYALFELSRATGAAKYSCAAAAAFRYERHWFVADVGNWPDFRTDPSERRQRQQPSPFAVYWCHGALGIALSRLRAYEITKNAVYRAEAQIALQTTQRMLETRLRSTTENYSLCHGLAGNAEVLRYGCQVLGDQANLKQALIHQVANLGIEQYGDQIQHWPGGVNGGENPSLMVGWAGIGHFYLHLYHSHLPSPLLLRTSDFVAAMGKPYFPAS